MQGMLNRERLYRSLTTLDIFVDKSLHLTPKSAALSGFNYNKDLLKASMANTYLETVGNRADSIHLAVKSVNPSDIYWTYLKTLHTMLPRTCFQEHDAVMAFDHTDEEFYGSVETAWIHNWTGEHAVTGKFKFLTCALVGRDVPEKVPLLSIPVHVGYSNPADVSFMLELVRPLFRSIRLALFDRGFYNNELMLTLSNSNVPYLIFVPKNGPVKGALAPMRSGDMRTVEHEFRVNRDKTVLKGETTYALLRQIYERRLDRCIDWSFATNRQEIDLGDIVSTYRQRWNIENAFRMQDEAAIRSKSKEVSIRFFYFAYGQLLQLIWSVFYREEVSFKGMLIALSDTCTERVERAEGKAAGKRSKADGI